MKKLLGILSFVALVNIGYSQQDYQFTQFQFDRVSLNPGAVGLDNSCLGIFYRNQWVDIGGEPRTFLVNYHMPVKQLRGGLGFTGLQDNLGTQATALGSDPDLGPAVVNSGFRLSYSYHHKMSGGTLGIGASVGYQGVSIGSNWFALDDPTLDPAIPTNEDSAGAADFNFGVFYKANNYWAGLSTTHISAADIQGTTINFDVARHYYFMAGMNKTVSNWEISPSLLLKTDATSFSADVNVTATWNQLVWGGLGYRTQDGINPMAGVNIPLPEVANLDQNLRLGVAYDVNLSELGSQGGFELFLGYCWKFTPPVIRKPHSNPRFL